MQLKSEPLGFFMCLPLAFLGGMVGAVVGFVVPMLSIGSLTDDNGLLAVAVAVVVGIPSGAVVGAALGFRTARRL